MNYNKHFFWERFKLIISDPTNKLINKLSNSGALNGEVITMYNEVFVNYNSYYGSFSDILLINEGVHEPSEEYLFQKVLSEIKTSEPVMLELGSYWGFYSISFLNKFKHGKSYCVEAGLDELSSGLKNFELNGLKGDFTHAMIGNNGLKVDDFVASKNIDKLTILHADIQGYELEMLYGAVKTLSDKKVEYLFISSHSDYLHNKCLEFLHNIEYLVVAEVNVSETFCEDGIILAVNPNINFDKISLPRRSQHSIITNEHLENLFRNKI